MGKKIVLGEGYPFFSINSIGLSYRRHYNYPKRLFGKGRIGGWIKVRLIAEIIEPKSPSPKRKKKN